MTSCIEKSAVQNCHLSVGIRIPTANSKTKLPLDLKVLKVCTATGLDAKPSNDENTVRYVHTQVPFPKN